MRNTKFIVAYIIFHFITECLIEFFNTGAIPRQVIQKNDIFLPTRSDFDKIRQSDRTSLFDCKKLIFFKNWLTRKKVMANKN